MDSGNTFDPVEQVRKGTHGLAKWIGGKTNIYQKMGYAIVFPDANMDISKLPPALVDYSRGEPQRFALDRNHLNSLGQWITNIMSYWKKELNTPILSPSRITVIVGSAE